MKMKILLLILTLIFLFSLVLLWSFYSRIKHERENYSNIFSRIRTLNEDEIAIMRKYRNPTHIEFAKKTGVQRIISFDQIPKHVSKGKFVAVHEDSFYMYGKMTYSRPYLTPTANRLLHEISKRFQDSLYKSGLPPYNMTISSLLRSQEAQKSLMAENSNAASISSHEFGTTFDINYDHFEQIYSRKNFVLHIMILLDRAIFNTDMFTVGQERKEKIKAILGRVLIGLQEEKQCLIIYEIKQPVYHITSNR